MLSQEPISKTLLVPRACFSNKWIRRAYRTSPSSTAASKPHPTLILLLSCSSVPTDTALQSIPASPDLRRRSTPYRRKEDLVQKLDMEPEPIAPLAPSPTAAAGPSQQPPEQSEPREQEALPTPAGPSTTTRAAPAEAPEGKAIDLKVGPLSVIELSLLIPMDGQAEADYLRRLNARNPTTTSRGSGKDNDLFGKEALESQMNSLGEHFLEWAKVTS